MNNQEKYLPFQHLSIIVATDEENGIGKNNQLMWHLPKDLKFFKNTTSGHTVIMGRKTYESMGKALPNRKNIVISRNPDLKISDAEIYTDLETAVKACASEKETFIIGGGEIYRQALPFIHKIYITKVHHIFNADTFFPKIDALNWELTFKEEHKKDEKHQYDFSFHVLEKH